MNRKFQPEKKDRSTPRRAGTPVQEASELREEIAMLRGVMRRVEALTADDCSLAELLRILSTLGQASTRLATLLKAEKMLDASQDVSQVLNQAIEEVLQELKQRAS
jgi:hypothetical protein